MHGRVERALRGLGRVVVEGDGGERAGADRRDCRLGGVGDAFDEARGEFAALVFGQQVLAPIVDERLLAEVGGGGERRFDGFPAEFLVAGDLEVESPGEGALRHGGAADHKGFELLPARRGALAFPLEQTQALRTQEEARMLGKHRYRIVGRLGGQRYAEAAKRGGEPDFGPHQTDCVMATQLLPSRTTKLHMSNCTKY